MSDTADTVAAAAQPGAWNEPFRSYLFKLVLDGGTDVAHFTSVSGLGVDIETIEYREAGANSIVHQLPGRVAYPEVVLSYGVTSSAEIWDWLMSAVSGNVRRSQVSISLLDLEGTQQAMAWNLADAWPKAWHGAPLDALGNDAAIANLTLVHQGITQDVTPPAPPTPPPTAPAPAE